MSNTAFFIPSKCNSFVTRLQNSTDESRRIPEIIFNLTFNSDRSLFFSVVNLLYSESKLASLSYSIVADCKNSFIPATVDPYFFLSVLIRSSLFSTASASDSSNSKSSEISDMVSATSSISEYASFNRCSRLAYAVSSEDIAPIDRIAPLNVSRVQFSSVKALLAELKDSEIFSAFCIFLRFSKSSDSSLSRKSA